MRKIIYFLSLFLLFSCNTKEKKNISIESIDIDKIAEVKLSPDEVIRCTKYVQLETNDSCLIGNKITKLLVKDNKIFILDSNWKVLVFDINGNFLNTIGEVGNGPKEQQSIIGFYVQTKDKYVGVFDYYRSTLFKYSYDGTLLDKIKYERSKILSFASVDFNEADNTLVFSNSNSTNIRFNYSLVDEKTMKVKEQFYPYLITNNVLMDYGYSRIAMSKDQCFLLTQYSSIVQRYSNGAFEPYLNVNTHLKQVTKDTRFTGEKDTGTPLDFERNLRQDGYSLGLEQTISTDKYLYLSYNDPRDHKSKQFFRNLDNNKSISIVLDDAFYKSPFSELVSFGYFSASTSNCLISTIYIRNGFSEMDIDVINKNESLQKIRANYKEDNNPTIAFININKLLDEAQK